MSSHQTFIIFQLFYNIKNMTIEHFHALILLINFQIGFLSSRKSTKNDSTRMAFSTHLLFRILKLCSRKRSNEGKFCLIYKFKLLNSFICLQLWVPDNSQFLVNTKFIMNNFGEGVRTQNVLVVSRDDVLTPEVLLKLAIINKEINDIRSVGENGEVDLEKLCFK
jgi:hypothetical protein